VATTHQAGRTVVEPPWGFSGELVTRGRPLRRRSPRLTGMIDRRPTLIARCTDVADVIAIVRSRARDRLDASGTRRGHNAGGLGAWDDAIDQILGAVPRLGSAPLGAARDHGDVASALRGCASSLG
jgi:hypothetical protein